MTDDQLERLRIASHQKRRSGMPIWFILFIVVGITAGVAFYAVPRSSDKDRSGLKSGAKTSREEVVAKADKSLAERNRAALSNSSGTNAAVAKSAPGTVDGSVLTVSGYIIARERIEVSPRFMGVVKWIGVKKGDSVTNGQVVVLLDEAEYQARLAENDGLLAAAKVGVDRAKLDLQRAEDLVKSKVEMQKFLDDSLLTLRSAEAQVVQIVGARKMIETWLEWCVIKSPVNGVVLEKMVDPNELVTPQTFGGTRGPSTSLIAVADLNDLQVEIDVDESKLAKVSLGQRCKIAPVSYPDKHYDGVVVEIAPEANRSKGTVQIKVQIQKPDHFLTPELSATVDFIAKQG